MSKRGDRTPQIASCSCALCPYLVLSAFRARWMWARRPFDSHHYCLVCEAFLLYSLKQWPLTTVSTVLLIQSLQHLLGDWHNASKPLQAAGCTASCLWKQLQESTLVIVRIPFMERVNCIKPMQGGSCLLYLGVIKLTC